MTALVAGVDAVWDFTFLAGMGVGMLGMWLHIRERERDRW